jgi:hypothetical protein
MKYSYLLFTLLIAFVNSAHAEGKPFDLENNMKMISAYDPVFYTASKDEADSVPLGNGTTGINLWVEENGDLLFYVSRNDAISEMHRLLKLGRVRVQLDPNPFVEGAPFEQRLHLGSGRCEIKAGQPGEEVHLQVVVDSDSEVIYVHGSSDQPVQVIASLEIWRTEDKVLGNQEQVSTWNYRGGIPPRFDVTNLESADVVVGSEENLTWYHRNEHSPVPVHVELQHLQTAADRIPDPILHRTFGGTLYGPDFRHIGDNRLALSNPATSFDLRIATHSEQTETADAFLDQLHTIADQSVSPKVAMERTGSWWETFWNRAWVYVQESDTKLVPENEHLLHIGAGRNGSLAINGEISRVSIFHSALSREEIQTLSQTGRMISSPVPGGTVDLTAQAGADTSTGKFNGGYLSVNDSTDWRFPEGFTMELWVKPANEGRIFDKITPGEADGMLIDIYQGKLRLIAGDLTFTAEESLPLNTWSHVLIVGKPGESFGIYQNGEKVAGTPPTTDNNHEIPSQVTQMYLLTRYQFAAQQRSIYPSHFNGGIFTVAPEFAFYATDPRGKNWSADYRFYGPSFWWQNTRFMYQLHLAQGNYDLMDSFYDFYFGLMDVFESMAETYYGAEGLYMNETISHFGLPGMKDFGWGAKKLSNPYIRYIWQGALEFGAFALDRYDYTLDREFLQRAIDWCDRALSFYDTRFEKGEDGKIVIQPTQGVETYWHGVVGDMPSIAGLQEITRRLLALPEAETTPEQRARWERIAAAVPELPKRQDEDGLWVPDVAQEYNPVRSNFEAPHLYCVYPFRIYGLERGEHDIEEARRGWHGMHNKGHTCWYQTGLFAARLGMTEQAKKDVLIRSGNRLRVVGESRNFRFPGFYYSPHDWMPDYDGPGNMSNTLQEMLVQPGPENKILLLPAWPGEWNVTFKLYAPGNTTVEGTYEDGQLVNLSVTPAHRKQDLVFPPFLSAQ